MVHLRLRTGMSGKEISGNYGILEGLVSKVFAAGVNFLKFKKLTSFFTGAGLQLYLCEAFRKLADRRVRLDGTDI